MLHHSEKEIQNINQNLKRYMILQVALNKISICIYAHKWSFCGSDRLHVTLGSHLMKMRSLMLDAVKRYSCVCVCKSKKRCQRKPRTVEVWRGVTVSTNWRTRGMISDTHTDSKNTTCNFFHQACLHFCFTHLINVIPWPFLFLFQHFLVLWGTVSIISCVRVYSCDPNTFWGGFKQQAGRDMIDFLTFLLPVYRLFSVVKSRCKSNRDWKT